MIQSTGMAVLAGAVIAAAARGGAGAQPTGPGLTIKDLQRVEQLRGDAGGLSTSLARGPASLAVPNDFSGVYKVPENADSPYAGWYARVSGAMIAVFPRGEYKAGPGGMTATVPANTRYFLGSIPLNDHAIERKNETAKGTGATAERVNGRVVDDSRFAEPERAKPPAPDAPPPATVETAKDAAGVCEAMGKFCGDPVYRANRLRELLDRAERTAGSAK